MTWSYILLNREKTYDPIAGAPTAQARQEGVDRLVHGLGLLGHPDPERFPDSALGPHLRLNPGAMLFPIDRDVLVASHTIGTREEVTADLGPWNGTSTHLMGELGTEGGRVAFGVRSRHGFHEPWFEGRAPGRDLGGTRDGSGGPRAADQTENPLAHELRRRESVGSSGLPDLLPLRIGETDAAVLAGGAPGSVFGFGGSRVARIVDGRASGPR